MKAETLKKAILQYAMQGKLVEQDPNDEPALVLLERIKAEKEQLIKEGKIKKEKPLPPITEDEIPYELPKGWEWARFSECIDVRDGTHDSPKYQTTGYPFVTSKNLNNGQLDFSNIHYISEEDFEKFSERSYVDNEDVLFAMIGSIGNPVIVKKDREFSIKNVALFKKSNFISVKYLYYYLLYIQEILKSNASGAVQSFVSLSTLRAYLFALPPRKEQERIVEKLEQILPLVEEYGKNEEKLSKLNSTLPEKIKQSILQHAVQGKLVPQNPDYEPASELLKRIKAEKEQLIKDGKIKKEKPLPPLTQDEIPFEIPDSWEWVKLGDICSKIVDGDHNPPAGYPVKTDYLMLSASNINCNKIVDLDKVRYLKKEVFKEENKRTNLQVDDILFTIVGTLGRSCIYDGNLNICFQRSVSVLTTLVYNKYLKTVLDSPYIQTFMQTNATGTAQKGFYLNQVANLLIPVPPLAEQQRIVDKVNKLMEFIETLANNNRLVKDSASNLLKSIEKKSLTEYSCKNRNTIDIKEKRAILSAKIISQLYNKQHFGAIKLEKIIYLCEKHLKINLGGDYKQEAAGPHDAQSRYEVEDILKNKKWFSVRKEQKNNIEVTKYIPLEKSNEISEIFNNVFNAEATGINNLLELFRGKNSDFCESVATLYAVWLNRLSNNLSCTDTDLIADFKAWSKQKARFYDSDLQDRILFMRRKILIPDSNIK